MFTPPDLDLNIVAAALRDGWGIEPAELVYQPIGFGSHHWLVRDALGERWFATVDDLSQKLRNADDSEDQAFQRLAAAFGAAFALQHEVGLDFVVGPLPAADHCVVRRITGRYSLCVHPFVDGRRVDAQGEFATEADRREVLDLIDVLHRARVPEVARPDDFEVPGRYALETLLGPSARWSDGPYAADARALLDAQAEPVRRLLDHYDELVVRIAARPERMVMTHGEPHASNVLRTPAGLKLIDWDTALVAAPERDLWMLAESDPSVVRPDADIDALALYRLWYDLAEIGGYLRLFAQPHERTVDTAESWQNLLFFLRPEQRWPTVFADRRPAC